MIDVQKSNQQKVFLNHANKYLKLPLVNYELDRDLFQTRELLCRERERVSIVSAYKPTNYEGTNTSPWGSYKKYNSILKNSTKF